MLPQLSQATLNFRKVVKNQIFTYKCVPSISTIRVDLQYKKFESFDWNVRTVRCNRPAVEVRTQVFNLNIME